jgi:hypothetical protein
MTRKITKPLCLLLDTNVIIKAHELGIWSNLMQDCHLLLPGTIIGESIYYIDKMGNRINIDLQSQVNNGMISQIDPTVEDLFKFNQLFASWFIQTLHHGETEALALICVNKAKDAYLCTSDAPAIRALAMMHSSDLGISLEELLRIIGLTKPLEARYTEGFFKNNLGVGSRNLITGQGYASPDFKEILKSLNL